MLQEASEQAGIAPYREIRRSRLLGLASSCSGDAGRRSGKGSRASKLERVGRWGRGGGRGNDKKSSGLLI